VGDFSRETGETIGLSGLIVWPDIDGVEELEVAYLLERRAGVAGSAPRSPP
jgi:hypothetical protein